MQRIQLLDLRLAIRDLYRHAAEFQVRVAALNSFTAIGTSITKGRKISLAGQRDNRPSSDSCERAFKLLQLGHLRQR